MRKGVTDKLDIQILNLLQEDGRLSARALATKLETATGTVLKRVADLQNKGILKKYGIVVDPTKLGYSQTAVLFIQTKGRLEFIKSHIAKMPNVVSVYQITGSDFDVVLTAKFKDNLELTAFVKQMLKMSGVLRVVTGMALDVIKEDVTSLCLADQTST